MFSFLLFLYYRTEIKCQAGNKDLMKRIKSASKRVELPQERTSSVLDSSISQGQRTFNYSGTKQSSINKTSLNNLGPAPTLKNPTNQLAGPTKMASPVPCGESFFEADAVFTQSHVDFMSKFKKRSLNGSSGSINISPLAPSKICASTPYGGGRSNASIFNSGNSSLNNSVNTDNSYINNSGNQSYSNISPNRSQADLGANLFDTIDDDMNLQMAEDEDCYDDLDSLIVASKGDNISKGWNSSTVSKGNNSSFPQEMLKDDFIDEFDEDEDFNAIIDEKESQQASRQQSSRLSISMNESR